MEKPKLKTMSILTASRNFQTHGTSQCLATTETSLRTYLTVSQVLFLMILFFKQQIVLSAQYVLFRIVHKLMTTYFSASDANAGQVIRECPFLLRLHIEVSTAQEAVHTDLFVTSAVCA
jgi:hypothetical protein